VVSINSQAEGRNQGTAEYEVFWAAQQLLEEELADGSALFEQGMCLQRVFVNAMLCCTIGALCPTHVQSVQLWTGESNVDMHYMHNLEEWPVALRDHTQQPRRLTSRRQLHQSKDSNATLPQVTPEHTLVRIYLAASVIDATMNVVECGRYPLFPLPCELCCI
jgi:hypothetical protein